MSEITVTALDDEPGRVYLFGLSPDAPDPIREWFYTEQPDEGFQSFWDDTFDHASMLVVTSNVESVGVAQLELDDVQELMPDE